MFGTVLKTERFQTCFPNKCLQKYLATSDVITKDLCGKKYHSISQDQSCRIFNHESVCNPFFLRFIYSGRCRYLTFLLRSAAMLWSDQEKEITEKAQQLKKLFSPLSLFFRFLFIQNSHFRFHFIYLKIILNAQVNAIKIDL